MKLYIFARRLKGATCLHVFHVLFHLLLSLPTIRPYKNNQHISSSINMESPTHVDIEDIRNGRPVTQNKKRIIHTCLHPMNVAFFNGIKLT